MTDRETLERNLKLLEEWPDDEEEKFARAIRSLLEENKRLRADECPDCGWPGLCGKAAGCAFCACDKLEATIDKADEHTRGLLVEVERLRDKLYGKLECGHSKYNDDSYGGCVACGYHKTEAEQEAIIDAALALHRREASMGIDRPECAHCHQVWPCPTYKALKGEREKEWDEMIHEETCMLLRGGSCDC